MRASLSLEGLRSKAALERAKVQADYNSIWLKLMNLEAVILASDSEIIDFDIQIATSKSDSSKEEIDQLTKDYEEHYQAAMEALRTREEDDGMQFDPIPLPPSSSPLRRYAVGSSPMSGIHVMHSGLV